MNSDTGPLPADLAKPRRARMSASDRAGIITGAGLLVIIAVGLIYALTGMP